MALPGQTRPPSADELPQVPLGGTRAQALHRLQLGVAGVLGILMLIGLVSLIEGRARQTEMASVPEAASTSVPESESDQADPLVEAGVMPDLPQPPSPAPGATNGTGPD